MTVALLLACVDGYLAVLGDVPARPQVLADVLARRLALLVQHVAHLREHLRVRAALHRQHLALVVVPEADVERADDALGGLNCRDVVLEVDRHVGAGVLEVQCLSARGAEVGVNAKQKLSNAVSPGD